MKRTVPIALFLGGILIGFVAGKATNAGQKHRNIEPHSIRLLVRDQTIPLHMDSVEVVPFRMEIDGRMVELGTPPENFAGVVVVTSGNVKTFAVLPRP